MSRVGRKQVLQHFSRCWYVYLAYALAVIFLVSWIFGLITEPTKEQRVNVFIGAQSCKKSQLYSALNKQNNTYLREINVDFYPVYDGYFSRVYSTRGVLSADIIILPASKISNNDCQLLFAQIAQETMEKYTPLTMEFYRIGDVIYGIKVYDAVTKKGCFDDFVGYAGGESDEDYYLFLVNSSANLGELSDANNEKDAALIVVAMLLEG